VDGVTGSSADVRLASSPVDGPRPVPAAGSAMLLGFLGVLAFSATLPATRVADPAFGAWTVAFGRALLAAAVAAAILRWRGVPLLPPRSELRSLVVVAVGVVIGFPLFTSLALESVDSSHGAVVTGLIPAATAGFGVLLAGERPRPAYWAALVIGLAGVLSLPALQGHPRPRPGDLFLLAAVAFVGFGYAQGGVLARTYAGWRVICWALIVSLPVTVPVSVVAWWSSPPAHVTAQAVGSMLYLGAISMCLGFFVWYEGLARGGVARVGRLQLVQPVLTMVWAVAFLGERVTLPTASVAALIVASVAVGRRAGGAPPVAQHAPVDEPEAVAQPQLGPGVGA
jgi:drug/metabolite transporter (DMT)-like permease